MGRLDRLKGRLTNKSLRSEFLVIWKFFYNNAIAYVLLYAQNVLINHYMPTDLLGQYSYTQSLLVLFTSVYSMEAYSAYLRFIGINNEEYLLKLVRRILFIASVLFSITVFVFFDSPFYVLFAGYMWMRERLYFFRSKMDITTYGRIKVIQYVVSIFIIGGLVVTESLNHETVLIGIGLSYVFVSVLYTFNRKAKSITAETDDLSAVKTSEIIKYALPLSFNAIVVWVLGAADQMLIDNFMDPLTLTYYSVGFRIINVIRIGVGVIMEYWPRFYFERMEKMEYSAVRIMKMLFLGVVTVLCLGTVILSKQLYWIMGASQYIDMRWMFCYLAMAEMFRQWGSILITYQSFMKNTLINVICLSVLGFAKFIVNWFTIESMGVNILFYSTLACYFLYFLVSMYFGFYKERKFMQSNE
ncbi:MAG: hypothetical protein HFI38_13190 [Lachnospiraceae bacterium]|nr:hypothetical protein [Lachnospiraceae bacterium]